MTIRQLQNQAYSEWNCSTDIQRSYHTFEYYWFERYARVYHLPARIRSAGLFIHKLASICGPVFLPAGHERAVPEQSRVHARMFT